MFLGNAILETTRLTYPVASHSITIVLLRLMSPVKLKRPAFLRPDTNLDYIVQVLHDRRNIPHNLPSIPSPGKHSRQRAQYLLCYLMDPDIKVYNHWTILINWTARSLNPLSVYKINL